MAMSAIWIKNWRTYSLWLKDLEDYWFIVFIERSKNQYSANIISIFACVKNTIATTKALDKAVHRHSTKHSSSTVGIDKPVTSKLITSKPVTIHQEELDDEFDNFWNTYDKKVDKKKVESKYWKLKQSDRDRILEVLPDYIESKPDPQYRKNPLTWLNGECWNDEIEKQESNILYL